MAKRKDGEKTKQKLLDAACEVFAEKGFHAAKITDICHRAGANVAAVNYHFGDKDTLYVAVWRQVMEEFLSSIEMPPNGLSPEEQLGFAIHRIIRKILPVDHKSDHFRRMELMELANPTGLIDEIWKEIIAPRKQEMHRIIRNILGPDASEDSVTLCEMSVINQLRGYILLQTSGLDATFIEDRTPERANEIAEHISCFSIAGIRAVRNQCDRK